MDMNQFMSNLQDVLSETRDSVGGQYDRTVERALDRMGLQPKRSTMNMVLPALGIFGAGLAVGASLGLLFAPRRGEEIRGSLVHRVEEMRGRSNGVTNQQVPQTTPIQDAPPPSE